MNELQMSLIGVGAVVVAAIYAYNLWQERRHRKVAETMFPDKTEDVLIGSAVSGLVAAETKLHDRADPEPDAIRREPVIQSGFDVHERREPSLSAPVFEIEKDPEPQVVPDTTRADTPDAVEASTAFATTEAEVIVETVLPDRPLNVTGVSVSAAPDVPAAKSTLPAVPVNLYFSRSDAAARLELVSPLKAAELLLMGLEAFSRVGKPVFWLGFDHGSAQWLALSAETPGQFSHLQVVLQLADRQGPINVPELHVFLATVQEIAVQLNAVLDIDDFGNAQDRARDIDHFCADVDLQIGINVVGTSPFLGTKIRALAEAAGMTINWQGAFEKIDDNGRCLFVMSNLETTPFANDSLKTLRTHGLTFVLDVPRVLEGGFVFDHLLRLVRQFADVLQGKIVDDNKRPLHDQQLANIRSQFVVGIQEKMAAQGIVAGSPLALRLFS